MNYFDYLNLWIDTYKKRTLKASTYTNYRHQFAHLTPLFAQKTAEITVFDCQAVINTMIDKGLSLSAVKHVITILRQSFNKAVQLGFRSDNPALFLEYQRSASQRVTALNDIEVAQLLKYVGRSFYGSAFLFLLSSGLRAGELIELRYSDFDVKNSIFTVSRSNYRGHITTTKTIAGERVIPLNSALVRLIDCKRSDNGLVFTNTAGGPIDYGCFLKAWHRLQVICGYQTRYGLHAFRHTFATRLLRLGVDPKTISELLGHSDVRVTLNVYCDGDLGLKRSAMTALSEVVRL